MRHFLALFALSILSACASQPRQRPTTADPVPAPRPYSILGLESVIGNSAAAVASRLGRPDLDLREGPARKLQFLSTVCVLDVYFYPARSGSEPVATHVDARQPDGRDMDRSSCVAALLARRQSR